MLRWAVRALGEALEAGKASGLVDDVKRLSTKAGGELVIKVVRTRDLGKESDPRNGKPLVFDKGKVEP